MTSSSATPHAYDYSIPKSLQDESFLVIGLSGKSGSGKDYMANEVLGRFFMEQMIRNVSVAFATNLKLESHHDKGIPLERLFVYKDARDRVMLQEKGVERRQQAEDYWIRQAHANIIVQLFNGVRVICITDVRFLNEIEYVRRLGSRGLLIRIEASKRVHTKLQKDYQVVDAQGHVDEEKTKQVIEKIANHVSETQAQEYKNWDIVIDNDFDQQDVSGFNLLTQISETKAFQQLLHVKQS